MDTAGSDVGRAQDREALLLRLLLAQRTRRSESRGGTRARLLTESVPLFASRGYAGTSMRDIAAAAGIKAASIYEHFSGKEQLLHEALVGVLGQFHDFILEVLNADQTAEHQLRLVVERHVTWQLEFFEIAGAWDVLFDIERVAGVLPPELAEDVRRRRALYHEFVHALVAELRPEDREARVRAEAILALCDRVAAWAEAREEHEPEVGELAWALARALVAAPIDLD